MKSVRFMLGMACFLFLFGMVFIGCDLEEGKNDKLIITGFNDSIYGKRLVSISLYPEFNFSPDPTDPELPFMPSPRGISHIISDSIEVSGQDITFPLRQNGIWAEGKADWNGSFYVLLDVFKEGEKYTIDRTYVFSNGIIPNEQFSNIPKYTIGKTNIISFNLFMEYKYFN
jgi:hypothetical protein